MSPKDPLGIMSGYGVRIRQLRYSDLETYPELRKKVAWIEEEGKFSIDWCIAIFGEDLAEGLAAVIYVAPGSYELVWHDTSVISDQQLTNIPNPQAFVEAVMQVVHAVHPSML